MRRLVELLEAHPGGSSLRASRRVSKVVKFQPTHKFGSNARKKVRRHGLISLNRLQAMAREYGG